MKATNATKVPLGILLREESDRGFNAGYYHILGNLVTTVDGKVRNPSSSSYDQGVNGWGRLADLQINSQADTDRVDHGLYGFDVRYRNVSFVDTAAAKRMAQTLTRIDRGLEKLQAKRGYTTNFGEYVGRVAEVLGVESIIVDRTSPDNRGWSYDEGQYQFLTIGEGVNYINGMVREWQRKNTPIPATATENA